MTPADAVDAFIARFSALGVPFGCERSCKIGPRGVRPDRCLVSFGRTAFGTPAGEGLAAIIRHGRDLGAPAILDAWLRAHEAGAPVVHFGCDADDGRIVHKIYLEYVEAARQAMTRPASQAGVLVHRALKWVVETGATRESQYRLMPPPSRGLAATLDGYGGGAPSPVIGFAEAVFERAAARLDPRDMVLLDVADTPGGRRSFDLNVYEADLALAAIESDLAQLAQAFRLPPLELAAALSGRAGATLGHVAGGLDEAARPFVTLYYGVEAR